jgi:hypothetical protein
MGGGTHFEETMNEFLQRDLDYVIRLDEVMWGCLLLAVTIIIHAAGLFFTTRLSAAYLARMNRLRHGLGTALVVMMVWMIVVLHLTEVAVWAGFFTWKDAQPNVFSAFYNALVNYTTLGAGYLPLRWRLLEGMLGMAGLLSFAFSTSVLVAVAQHILQRALTEHHQEAERSPSRRRTPSSTNNRS